MDQKANDFVYFDPAAIEAHCRKLVAEHAASAKAAATSFEQQVHAELAGETVEAYVALQLLLCKWHNEARNPGSRADALGSLIAAIVTGFGLRYGPDIEERVFYSAAATTQRFFDDSARHIGIVRGVQGGRA